MLAIDQGVAKSIEQDYKQIYVDTARLTAALIAEILQKLKKSPELKVEIEDEKQPKVEIKVGREIAYRGVEGEAPEINKLTPKQVEYLADVLAQPAADKSSAPTPNKEMNRAVTIKVNDKVVYKLSKGVVEINKLQPELAAEIAKSIAPPERWPQSEPPQASPSNQKATSPPERSPSSQANTTPPERSPSSEVTTAPKVNQTSEKAAPSQQKSQPAPAVQLEEIVESSVAAPSQLEKGVVKSSWWRGQIA